MKWFLMFHDYYFLIFYDYFLNKKTLYFIFRNKNFSVLLICNIKYTLIYYWKFIKSFNTVNTYLMLSIFYY